MAQKEKISKERERLLAESKKALAGLGMSNESAVAEILKETLGEEIDTLPDTNSDSDGRHVDLPNGDHDGPDVEPDQEFIENIRVNGVRTPIHVRPIGKDRYEIVAREGRRCTRE